MWKIAVTELSADGYRGGLEKSRKGSLKPPVRSPPIARNLVSKPRKGRKIKKREKKPEKKRPKVKKMIPFRKTNTG